MSPKPWIVGRATAIHGSGRRSSIAGDSKAAGRAIEVRGRWDRGHAPIRTRVLGRRASVPRDPDRAFRMQNEDLGVAQLESHGRATEGRGRCGLEPTGLWTRHGSRGGAFARSENEYGWSCMFDCTSHKLDLRTENTFSERRAPSIAQGVDRSVTQFDRRNGIADLRPGSRVRVRSPAEGRRQITRGSSARPSQLSYQGGTMVRTRRSPAGYEAIMTTSASRSLRRP